MIIVGNIAYEHGDRYPELSEIPAGWAQFTGRYERHHRLSPDRAGPEVIGEASILFEDGALTMTGVIGPIVPIDNNQLVITGEPFAGETMEYDPATGQIYHQSHVYFRVSR